MCQCLTWLGAVILLISMRVITADSCVGYLHINFAEPVEARDFVEPKIEKIVR
jgi:hypothetical protein